MKVKKFLAKAIVTTTLSICMVAGCIPGLKPFHTVTTQAAPYTEPCAADVRNNGDGTMDIILKGDEDGTNVYMFDYGLVYDNTKLSVEKIQWDSSFKAGYTEGDKGIVSEGDLGTYVVVGGVYYQDEYMVSKDQNIVVVTFKVLDGVNTGEILLTDDSAQYDKDFTDAVGVILTMPESGLSRILSYESGTVCSSEQLSMETVLGDTNGDGKVDLADAQYVLKAALKITNLNARSITNLDVNEDSQINLTDAQWILKSALKLSTFNEMKSAS